MDKTQFAFPVATEETSRYSWKEVGTALAIMTIPNEVRILAFSVVFPHSVDFFFGARFHLWVRSELLDSGRGCRC